MNHEQLMRHEQFLKDKFEAWVVNNDIQEFDLKTEEDGLQYRFYVDPETRAAYIGFAAGFKSGTL